MKILITFVLLAALIGCAEQPVGYYDQYGNYTLPEGGAGAITLSNQRCSVTIRSLDAAADPNGDITVEISINITDPSIMSYSIGMLPDLPMGQGVTQKSGIIVPNIRIPARYSHITVVDTTQNSPNNGQIILEHTNIRQ